MTMDPKDMEGLQPRLREVLEKISSEAGGGVAWDDITNKPTEFNPAAHQHNASDITEGVLDAARIPTLAQSKITNLVSDLSSKLTASPAAAQADSTATDVETLVADFNALLAKLRAAGIMEE